MPALGQPTVLSRTSGSEEASAWAYADRNELLPNATTPHSEDSSPKTRSVSNARHQLLRVCRRQSSRVLGSGRAKFLDDRLGEDPPRRVHNRHRSVEFRNECAASSPADRATAPHSLQCGFRVRGGHHPLHQLAASRVSAPLRRRQGFHAPSIPQGFTPVHGRECHLWVHLWLRPFETHARFTFPHVRPFATASPWLLRPRLIPRSPLVGVALSGVRRGLPGKEHHPSPRDRRIYAASPW